MRTISISEFKAKCLAVIEDVGRTGEVVTILKRGRPVAQVVPASLAAETHPQHSLRGTVEIRGNIVEPALPPEAWDAERRDG